MQIQSASSQPDDVYAYIGVYIYRDVEYLELEYKCVSSFDVQSAVCGLCLCANDFDFYV